MLETVLVFVVVPLAIYAAVGLVTLRSKFTSTPRYRPGQEWDYPPVWWSANPMGVGASRQHAAADSAQGTAATSVRGGASGRW